MKPNDTLETNNLNNGQWSEINAPTTSPVNEAAVVVIETDSNFYSSRAQHAYFRDRKFVDRSSAKKTNNSNSVTHLFETSIPKDRSTKNGYTTEAVDPYRQGIEITLPKHTRGIIKMSAGTPGHFINPAPLGLNENVNLTDNDFFQEINLFNPIEFIDIQDENKLIEQVITFPIVTSDANQRENFILNGIIEPLPIRPIIAHFSIYFPVDPQGIKANLSNGDPFLKHSSDAVNSTYEFAPGMVNREPFLDAGESITMTNDTGDSTVEIGPTIPYMQTDSNYIEPFEDKVYARGDLLESTRSYESDLLEAIRRLKPMNTTYLNSNQFSGRTGFSYNDSVQGIDSIAFGGLTR